MRYLTFNQEESRTYKICILVNDIRRDEIERAYIRPYNLDPNEIVVLDLHKVPGKKSTPVKEQKAYLTDELAPVLLDLGVEYLIVGDGDYFKTLTKTTSKIDKLLGYVLDTEYGPWKVVYVPNFRTIFYDPLKVTQRIASGIHALQSWIGGTYKDPGVDIIGYCAYPNTVQDVRSILKQLKDMNVPLTVDIEGFSLKHYSAGIGTIAFAWSKTGGVAFPVDSSADPVYLTEVRKLLKNFFIEFRQKLIFHKIDYDVSVLIYQLFMKDILDNEGLLKGLQVMLRDWDCTRLISYLATNSCSGNRLGLKEQAQEYAGNYAVETIQNIRAMPLPQLLQYNLVDCLATWYVHGKHWPTLIADNQLQIYEDIFKPAMVDIIQMQLTGLPIDMARTQEVRKLLQKDNDQAIEEMQDSLLVREFVYQLNEEWVDEKNQTLKKKYVTFADADEEFNPNSGPQLIRLLYTNLELPIIARTDTGLPATDGDTLTALLNHTSRQDVKDFLAALIRFRAVNKILTSTIPAMEQAATGPDGWHYLFGNFNLGGTVSGRLSSSDPNLQNLPATGTRYAKLIKSCFKAPPGWFFCGIDFNSLEDRISALTTKDPNKLKVYLDGYDGHSLRTFSYFGDQMPDIEDTVESINSIQDRYSELRQDSKAPTFALTYQGTWRTLMVNCGFSEEKARRIEAKYHELYEVSDQWVKAKLDQASLDGYVTVAFGLRLRTPLLHQVVRGTSKTPFEADAEGRTAGNALGQSWCLLNSRAGSEFMAGVRTSEHRHKIKPCAQIHDAQYYLIQDDLSTIEYANNYVVRACEWQDHPDIWHESVRLGGKFSIFYPDWSHGIKLPNWATQEAIWEAFTNDMVNLAD
jgi:DNA polymerase-1